VGAQAALGAWVPRLARRVGMIVRGNPHDSGGALRDTARPSGMTLEASGPIHLRGGSGMTFVWFVIWLIANNVTCRARARRARPRCRRR
jgi:hypothetical protein